MPSGGMLKPTQSSPKVRHNPASKSSPGQSHSENDGTFTSPFGPSRQRSSNLTCSHGCPGVSQSITTSPALRSTVNIRASALVETFQSHLDGGLGSWNISVADNFTMESQTLWHGSRLLRNDRIRKQTERKRKPVSMLNCGILQSFSPILHLFAERLCQVHVSEVNSASQHDRFSFSAVLAFEQV